MIVSHMYQRSIISISSLSFNEIEQILSLASSFESYPNTYRHYLNNKVIASCFFEASTRTRLSFESAIARQGGKVIGFDSAENTSIQKGETLMDTMKIIEHYSDAIVMRHPNEGAAQWVNEHLNIPIINAGDGAHQHPTQTLLDLMSIQKTQGTLHGLKISILGDLRFSRTVHSLIEALQHVPHELCIYPVEGLDLPDSFYAGKKIKHARSIEEALDGADIIYMTRIQKERLRYSSYSPLLKNWQLREEHLKYAKKNMRILHPLPRVDEIDPSIDHSSHAYYFEQVKHGVSVRQALLSLVLNSSLSQEMPNQLVNRPLSPQIHSKEKISTTKMCTNPTCISHHERGISFFQDEKHRCYYCTQLME
jgi:aspartate carbamoyltransferase catalytic subunit